MICRVLAAVFCSALVQGNQNKVNGQKTPGERRVCLDHGELFSQKG
jgi:hypothetical protein